MPLRSAPATLRGLTLMESPETRYARSGDVSIAYQVIGNGPFDVVLVPAISHIELAWTMSNERGEIPRRLASFARLIVFDKRGMGMSDRVSDEPPLEVRMDDVRTVMDAAGSHRAALFGILDGAAMSLLFAATYPERTSALVLLTAFPRLMWSADFPWGITEEQQRARKLDFMRIFLGTRDEAARALRFVKGDAPTDEEIQRDIDYLRRAAASPNTLEAYLELYRQIDVRHVLPAIRVPTLLIHGSDAAPYRIEAARYMAEEIPSARLLELPGERSIPARPGLEQALAETEAFLHEVWEEGGWLDPEPDRILARPLHGRRRLERASRRAGRPGLAGSLAETPRTRSAAARPLPRPRSRHGGRRLPGQLRRPRPRDTLRTGNRRRRPRARARSPRRPPHRGMRVA
jgi:pimeloyl-ACP methyl ester carboxylesterase